MTYWLVLFDVDARAGSTAIKVRLSRAQYESLLDIEVPDIQFPGGNYTLLNKRMFAEEGDNKAFIISDGKKNKQ